MRNFKVDYKKMFIMVLIICSTTIVISGSLWLFVTLAQNNVSQTKNIEITNLENQIFQLREAIKLKEEFSKNNQALGASTVKTN